MRVDQKERSKNRHADVFIVAHAAQERGVTIAPGWIMRVARNKVVDRWRRIAHRMRIQERLRYRGLLRQHYLEGIPIAQMAAAAGASYTATESALARARRAFKKHHDVGA